MQICDIELRPLHALPRHAVVLGDHDATRHLQELLAMIEGIDIDVRASLRVVTRPLLDTLDGLMVYHIDMDTPVSFVMISDCAVICELDLRAFLCDRDGTFAHVMNIISDAIVQ